MAFTLQIPGDWIRQSPNLIRVPFLYTVDAAVGQGCPNKLEDVMLVQYMIYKWVSPGPGQPGGTGMMYRSGFNWSKDHLPVNGHFDNRVLAWIFCFQLMTTVQGVVASRVTGKVEPIRDVTSMDGSSRTMIELNVQYGGFSIGKSHPLTDEWFNMAEAGDIPPQLANALKKPRLPR